MQLTTTLLVVLVMAVRGASASAESGPDLNVDVTSASPSAGTPTYAETVEWLEGHAALHARLYAAVNGVESTALGEINESRFPCVLSVGIKVTTARKKGGTLWLVSLPLVNTATVAVERSRLDSTGTAGCLKFKGAPGTIVSLALEKVNGRTSIIEKDRRAAETFCFDTVENAERAAKALKHAATLCGARATKEAF